MSEIYIEVYLKHGKEKPTNSLSPTPPVYDQFQTVRGKHKHTKGGGGREQYQQSEQ
jgi:hypothetical protein